MGDEFRSIRDRFGFSSCFRQGGVVAPTLRSKLEKLVSWSVEDKSKTGRKMLVGERRRQGRTVWQQLLGRQLLQME